MVLRRLCSSYVMDPNPGPSNSTTQTPDHDSPLFLCELYVYQLPATVCTCAERNGAAVNGGPCQVQAHESPKGLTPAGLARLGHIVGKVLNSHWLAAAPLTSPSAWNVLQHL